MCKEDNIDKDAMNIFTVRLDPEAQARIEYLKKRKMLNKTAIIRLGISTLYQQEKMLDVGNN